MSDQDQPVAAEEIATPTETEVQEVTDTEKPEVRTFTQEEVDRIVQKRVNKLERKLERQQIEQQVRQEVSQPKVNEPEKPRADQYSDYADYLEALADYTADKKIRQREVESQQAREKQNQQTEAQRVIDRQQEAIDKGEAKYDDFEQVIKSDTNTYSKAAYLSILESDQSADILYYLAKNQDEAKRIASLPAYAQAKEIGKLEDKISKKPVKTSQTPAPISPLSGGSGNTKSADDMSMDEYMKMRKSQGARWA